MPNADGLFAQDFRFGSSIEKGASAGTRRHPPLDRWGLPTGYCQAPTTRLSSGPSTARSTHSAKSNGTHDDSLGTAQSLPTAPQAYERGGSGTWLA